MGGWLVALSAALGCLVLGVFFIIYFYVNCVRHGS